MPRSEKGFTLIELLIAMVITMIMFFGLTEGILISIDYNLRNALRDEAVIVGENRMAAIRSLPYDNVATGNPAMAPSVESRQVRNFAVAYTITPTVVTADPRRVDVTVAWTRAGKPYSQSFSTIVRQR